MQGTLTAFIMTQDKDIPTINLTVPTGWDKLADKQLRYVFGTIAQGTPAPPLVLPQVLRLSHATEGVLRGERRSGVLRHHERFCAAIEQVIDRI